MKSLLKLAALWFGNSCFLVFLLVVTSCASVATDGLTRASTLSACAASQKIDSCILGVATLELAQLQEDSDWINAAVDLSYAMDAMSKTSERDTLLSQALARSERIDDLKLRSKVLFDLSSAYIHVAQYDNALLAIRSGQLAASEIVDQQAQGDYFAKFATAKAKLSQHDDAVTSLAELSQSTENLASFKARAHKEYVEYLAKKGHFILAQQTVQGITYGLDYYKSTARSAVALIALKHGSNDLAATLLTEADTIARLQDDGYFLAGALRDIGASYYAIDRNKAMEYFSEAKRATLKGKTPQHRARALSRVATKLSDYQLYDNAKALFPQVIDILQMEESEQMRNYSWYEVVGSAAFSGDFETAKNYLEIIPDEPFGSAQSLRNAARRDLAWGLVRHGQVDEALRVGDAIDTSREKIQLMSRMVRLLRDPKMAAFTRYL